MRRLSSYENYSLDVARSEVWETSRVSALLRKGLKAGKAVQVAPRKWELHWQLGCLTPRWRQVVSRGASYSGKLRQPLSVVQGVPCRKCEGCMEAKARLWAARACLEFRSWPRTLMATFTTSPAIDAQFDALIAKRLGKLPEDPEELFAERSGVFHGELQAWAKRVRAAAEYRGGAKRGLRYLMVSERHKKDGAKGGFPHFHGLIYETKPGALIQGDPVEALSSMSTSEEYTGKYYKDSNGSWKKGVFLTDESLLRQQWKLGWNKFQVAFDELSAFYVLKYIAKEGTYRVYPSEHFGDQAWLDQNKTANNESSPALADHVRPRQYSPDIGEHSDYAQLLRKLSRPDGSEF